MWFILKIKKSATLVLLVLLSVCFSGCGNLFGQAEYTAGSQIPDKEAYLDFNATNKKQENTSGEFEVYTLEYGTFSTVMTPVKISVSSMITPNPIKAEFEEGEMEFISLEVRRMQEVKKGDVIAKVRMEIDDIDLEELNIRLTRLEESYQEAVDAYLKSQEDLMNEYVMTSIRAQIRDLRYQKAELNFGRTNANYQKQISELKKQISELKKNQKITEIVAPEDGYIMSISYNKTGDKLNNGQVLATYVTSDQICLEFEDTLLHYGYGMTCNLNVYVDRTIQNGNANVVSVSGKQLTAAWNRKSTKLKSDIPADKLLKSNDIMAVGETNVMNHVLLVPFDAVEKKGEYTYVVVLREDGKLEKRSFIAGGNNSQYYWVFDGLTEGTQIVIEH